MLLLDQGEDPISENLAFQSWYFYSTGRIIQVLLNALKNRYDLDLADNVYISGKVIKISSNRYSTGKDHSGRKAAIKRPIWPTPDKWTESQSGCFYINICLSRPA